MTFNPSVGVSSTAPYYTPNASSSGTSLTVQDENANVSTAVTQIDFQGAGVTTTSGTGEVIVTIPAGGVVPLILFGDGRDGDATISSNTNLSSDTFYNNLTVNAGVRLCTNGFRLFVKGTLTNNGTIHMDGSAGQTSGAAGSGYATGTLGPSGSGGNSSAAAGGNGTSAADGIGGSGGAGGLGSGGAGGTGGTTTTHSAVNGTSFSPAAPPSAYDMKLWGYTGGTVKMGAGSGGGGGGGDGSSGGGGGAGGGHCWVAAKTLAGTGALSANGGAGGDGVGSNRGGGGGGGGGTVVLITAATSNPYTTTVTGGAGGAKTGTGVAGTAGSAGKTFIHLGGS